LVLEAVSVGFDPLLDNCQALGVTAGPLQRPVEEVDRPPARFVRRGRVQVLTVQVREQDLCVPWVFTFELLSLLWLDDESDPVEEGPDVGLTDIGSQPLRITTYSADGVEGRCDAPHRQPVKSVAA